MHGTKLKKNYF